MDRIRIGNVEYLPGKGDEIILWYRNPNYGAQDRLLKEGYRMNDDGSMTRDNFTYHKSCFENEFSCYVVANVEWNSAHDEFDVKSCGCRAFELDESDYVNFREILKLISKHNHTDSDDE